MEEPAPTAGTVQLRLEEEDLWARFSGLGNEMIITKNGRCMFPLLRLQVAQVSGIPKDAMIHFGLSLEPTDMLKWKYRGERWRPVGRVVEGAECEGEESLGRDQLYEPPESPATGQYWVENGLGFTKVKLTNGRLAARSGPAVLPSHYFTLRSFRRYQPVVHYWRDDGEAHSRLPLKEAEFIAVTHYQNTAVTELKKSHNPHAKGFLHTLSPPPFARSSSPLCIQGLQYSHFLSVPGTSAGDVSLNHEDMAAGWLLSSLRDEDSEL